MRAQKMHNESLSEKLLLHMLSPREGDVLIVVWIRGLILHKIAVEGWMVGWQGFPGAFLLRKVCVFFSCILLLHPVTMHHIHQSCHLS